MSRPGFPIDAKQNISVNNTYVSWQGVTYHGTDPLSYWRYQFEDKVGNNTPGWPNAKQTNDYLRSRFTWNQDPLSVSGTVNNGPGMVDSFSGEWGNSFGLGFVPWLMDGNPFALGNEVNMVRERLIGKLIDQIQSNRVNLGEVLHTRAQTVSMVESTLNRLIGTAQSLRKGNFVGAARYLTGADPRTRRAIRTSGSGRTTSGVGGIPEQWLALQYGWKPLLQDIYNSCETVHKAWNDNGELFTANASAKETGSKIQVPLSKLQAHGPSLVIESGQREVSGKALVAYRVDAALPSNLSQLGITNPASLAWELLPYSFVVDWFYPVGSFLERLDYDRGLSFAYGWISIRARQDARLRIDSASGQSGNISANWFGGKGSGVAQVFTREALHGFPSVPPPRVKNPFSPTHFANGLSLLATALRGGKTPR